MADSRRKFDQEFRAGAVRIVRETGKPIAQVARELGINEGTLGNWVGIDRRARERGNGALSEDERAELVRLRRENAELAMERGMSQTLGRPLGEGSDGAVSLAVLIAAQREGHGVPYAVACRALGVSQAWFYKWRHGDASLRRARRAALDAAVAYLFRRRSGRDGSPPITAALQDLGWRVSKNTVADSMRRQGLFARPRRKRRGLTTADRRARKAPDLLRRDFAPPPAIDQRWVSDLTEIPTGEGRLYLASVLDLSSRRAVGFALGCHHDADLAAAAVQVAIAVRGGDVTGVVFHTDQGGEFTGSELAGLCARAGIPQSMGRTGSALDNAVAESFHSTLEFEVLSRNRFATHAEARRAVVAWLEEYNTVRFHSTNGLISPVEFEHGRRRPGAKSYDQLRRRRPHADPQNNHEKNESEAATPPDALIETLRDPHRRRAASGPAPPASRAAAAVAAATGRGPVAAAPGPAASP